MGHMLKHLNGSVLVVCTGNICRSPYIERALAQALADTSIEVTSAGTGALVGQPMDPQSVSRALAAGLAAPGIEGFVARQLTADMVRGADLIIAASRDHAGAAIQLSPRAMRYAFALPDLADLLDGASLNEINSARGATSVARVAAAAVARRGQAHPRQGESATIVDPYQQSEQVFDRMVEQINVHLPIVISALRGGH